MLARLLGLSEDFSEMAIDGNGGLIRLKNSGWRVLADSGWRMPSSLTRR